MAALSRSTVGMQVGNAPWWWAPKRVASRVPSVFREHLGFYLAVTVAVVSLVLALYPRDPIIWDTIRRIQDVRIFEVCQFLGYWGRLDRGPLFLVFGIGIAGWLRRDRKLYATAWAGSLSAISAGLTVDLLKVLFGRPRPDTGLPDGFHPFSWDWTFQSFPSGHSAHCIAIAVTVLLLMPRTGVVVMVAALTVAVSRAYAGYHFASDVVMGLWIGTWSGLLFGLAARRVLAGGGSQSPRA